MGAASKSPVGFVAIISKNHLAYARVLMSSIEEHHPEAPRLVVLADRIDGYFDPALERFQVILSCELDIPDSDWFHFRYDAFELSTALKPFAIKRAFGLLDVENVIYLDADIRVFAPLDPVVEALREASIVLTPHLLGPGGTAGADVERQMLRTGAYNLGFVGVRRSEEGESFLAWWCDRLAEYCVVDLPGGLFVDQKWVDLVPGMFDGVRVLREPGLNVGWWRSQAAETVFFFHFSGFDPENPETLSRHGNVVGANRLGREYAQALLSRGYAESKSWPYAYRHFKDGNSIPSIVRNVLDLDKEFQAATPDPFSEAGRAQIYKFWNQSVGAPDGSTHLTRLAYQAYRSDVHLQAAMPDVFGAHWHRFVSWFVSEGAERYELSAELTDPLRQAVAGTATAGVALSPLALSIHGSRRDLQLRFPRLFEGDALGLLNWLLTYGQREYDIDAENRRALVREFEGLVEQLRSPLARIGWRVRRALMSEWTRRRT